MTSQLHQCDAHTLGDSIKHRRQTEEQELKQTNMGHWQTFFFPLHAYVQGCTWSFRCANCVIFHAWIHPVCVCVWCFGHLHPFVSRECHMYYWGWLVLGSNPHRFYIINRTHGGTAVTQRRQAAKPNKYTKNRHQGWCCGAMLHTVLQHSCFVCWDFKLEFYTANLRLLQQNFDLNILLQCGS